MRSPEAFEARVSSLGWTTRVTLGLTLLHPSPDLGVTRSRPHRAAFDVVVTAAIFEELIKKAR